METTLHRQLKALYAPSAGQLEVRLGDYRIDAVREKRLIEIQASSLGAIRKKIRTLLADHDVLVVKPLAARKLLVKRPAPTRERGRGGGRGRGKQPPEAETRRLSPVREGFLHFFADLVYFVDVFPHPRLVIDVILTEQEELRQVLARPRWGRSYRIVDRRLVAIAGRRTLQTASDLVGLLPPGLPDPFTSADLARVAGIPRWLAQKMTYCLRQTGVATAVERRRAGWSYTIPTTVREAS